MALRLKNNCRALILSVILSCREQKHLVLIELHLNEDEKICVIKLNIISTPQHLDCFNKFVSELRWRQNDNIEGANFHHVIIT